MKIFFGALLVLALGLGLGLPGVWAQAGSTRVRIALFNIRELSTEKLLDVDSSGRGRHPQLLAAARIIQRIRPDILVINEIDHDYTQPGEGLELNARRFMKNYLGLGESGMEFPEVYAAPCNTGLLSGLDLNRDGHTATPDDLGTRVYGDDSYGFGIYPGQYSMAVLSSLPLEKGKARNFQRLLWTRLPGHHLPLDFYGSEIASALRLSSKSHWDLPVRIGEQVVHLLVSHPTPPGFDGDEDRNGRRNFDEIKFWRSYLDGVSFEDDSGHTANLSAGERFVVVGDLNAHPGGRDSLYDGVSAIDQLLSHPRVQDSGPFATSRGGLQGRVPGPPDFPERSTAVFRNGMRIDYILPSLGLQILGGGVFWPTPEEDSEGAGWAEEASDHRLVWLDLGVTPTP